MELKEYTQFKSDEILRLDTAGGLDCVHRGYTCIGTRL